MSYDDLEPFAGRHQAGQPLIENIQVDPPIRVRLEHQRMKGLA